MKARSIPPLNPPANTLRTSGGVLAACLFLAAGPASAAPVVSNVTVSQAPGSADFRIQYDLTDSAPAQAQIALAISSDGGATYNVPVASATGDVGTVAPGAGKVAIWRPLVDFPGQTSAAMRVRVTANGVVNSVPAGFVEIAAGAFTMGDARGEGEADESPVRTLDLPAFFMESTLVTRKRWNDVRSKALTLGYTFEMAGGGKADDHPAHSMTWYDAVKWCNALSESEGLDPVYRVDGAVYKTGQRSDVAFETGRFGYRLPTEAEWEKAASGAGAATRFPWGETISFANGNYYSTPPGPAYETESGSGFHPAWATGDYPYTSTVTAFPANPRGLRDMAGNLWQWCWDWYGPYAAANATSGPATGTTRVLRGGSWYSMPEYLRIANRGNANSPSATSYYQGFRTALNGLANFSTPFSVDTRFIERQIEPGIGSQGALKLVGSLITPDIDRDGIPDLLTWNRQVGVRYYRSRGAERTFDAPVTLFSTNGVSERGRYFDAGDLDGDGDLDLIVWGYWIENVDGKGNTWTQHAIPSWTGAEPYGLQFRDIDGDGDLDLIYGIFSTGQVFWLENLDAAGTFSAPHLITNDAGDVFSGGVTDLDGDGDPDLYLSESDRSAVTWYPNTDGKGTFGTRRVAGTVPSARYVSTKDLDGDGDLDLVCTGAGTGDGVYWIENLGGTFAPARAIAGEGGYSVIGFQADQTGLPSIAHGTATGKITLYPRNGPTAFGQPRILGNISYDLVRNVAAGDLDGDGDLDLIAAGGHDDRVTWYENRLDRGGAPRVPDLVTFAISGGAATTASAVVTLGITWAGPVPLEWMASESPAFTGAVWQTLGSRPAFTLGGSGTRQVYVKARNAAGESRVLSDTISFGGLPVYNTFAQAMTGYGRSGSEALPAADPNLDGVNNLMSYALGINPSQVIPGERSKLPQPGLDTGANRMTLEFQRPSPGRTDVAYVIRQSVGPLDVWTEVARRPAGGSWSGTAAVVESAAAGGAIPVKVTAPVTRAQQPRYFLRLRVETNP